MNALFWTLIILCFITSFVGLIFPLMPSVLLIWVGITIYYFFINSAALSSITWATFIIFTLLILIADYLANYYFVKRSGGSKWGNIMSVLGVFLGIFIFPPFGIIIMPFILVLITELIQQKTVYQALDIALGTVLGFFSSAFAKAIMQLTMILVFVFDLIFLTN